MAPKDLDTYRLIVRAGIAGVFVLGTIVGFAIGKPIVGIIMLVFAVLWIWSCLVLLRSRRTAESG